MTDQICPKCGDTPACVLREVIRKLEQQLAKYRKAAPLCEDHQPTNGTRSGCMICALIESGAAISRIDYLCGEPNEMEVSGFDMHCDQKVVIEHVRQRLAERAETIERWEAFEHQRRKSGVLIGCRCDHEDCSPGCCTTCLLMEANEYLYPLSAIPEG